MLDVGEVKVLSSHAFNLPSSLLMLAAITSGGEMY